MKDCFKDELISIIVPVYNCEKYLMECIESIRNQTYRVFELILFNDGSTDSSLDICEHYASLDDRIRVYSHQNIGVARTRQMGYLKANGKYIAFIDSDDSVKKDYIERLYSTICENGADVVCCNSIDEGVENLAISENQIIIDKTKLVEAFLDNKRYAYCIWGKLYRSELLKEIKFHNMKYAEDTYYVTEVFQNSEKVVLLKYAGYCYRDNANGAMRNSDGIQQEKDVLILYKYMLDLCDSFYPQYYHNCIDKMSDRLFDLVSQASVSSREQKEEAYDIIKRIILCYNEILGSKTIKNAIVKLYTYIPDYIMFFLMIYKKFFKQH